MLSRIIIIGFLAVIAWCLVSAFYFLIRDKGQGKRTLWRLTWRVALSMVLFVSLYIAFVFGWIKPGTPGPIGLKPPVEKTGGH